MNNLGSFGLSAEFYKLLEENNKLKEMLIWKLPNVQPIESGEILYYRLCLNGDGSYSSHVNFWNKDEEDWHAFVRRCAIIYWMYVPLLGRA